MRVERSTTATPTGLLFAFIALNFQVSTPIASVRFEFDVCAYSQTRKRFSLNIVGPWEIKFLFWSAAVSDLSFEITIFQQCFMHIHIPVSLRGVHQKRQPPPDVEKMVENGESAATLTANAMALASLRDFILFNFFCFAHRFAFH